MLILNTGGTFNKRYNPISGALEVPFDNHAVESILKALHVKDCSVAGAVYKDSLDMDAEDRKTIARIVMASQEERIVIIHGTDTMQLSAAVLSGVVEGKCVVFTGAMLPYSIDATEASANLGMAMGFAQNGAHGVYICMSGIVAPHDQIVKNRARGVFERV